MTTTFLAQSPLRARLSTLPVIGPLIPWTDPLHLAHRTLAEAIVPYCGLARGALLDLGCGVQPYRELFAGVEQYVGMDLPGAGRLDVAGSALQLPFPDQVFDTVLCNQVLEHVPEPARLVAEVMRVLRPGGVLLLTTPQTWGLHHEPYDYYRYTRYGLQYLAERAGLEVIAIQPTTGLWGTWAQRLADTVVYTYARNAPRRVAQSLGFPLAPVLMAAYRLDQLAGHRGDTLDNLLVARRPGSVA